MRLKIYDSLRTVSLNSKIYGCYKKILDPPNESKTFKMALAEFLKILRSTHNLAILLAFYQRNDWYNKNILYTFTCLELGIELQQSSKIPNL